MEAYALPSIRVMLTSVPDTCKEVKSIYEDKQLSSFGRRILSYSALGTFQTVLHVTQSKRIVLTNLSCISWHTNFDSFIKY
ncbi:unnamed protein product [Trifolium pratense]|uniref:Uncharacterized protein n=1 Tax=Trifolium pratense TaxID=57577 RepID=A0ACB0K9V7_TRIPR|nr:unnamed protein product [Trifolium pratense]